MTLQTDLESLVQKYAHFDAEKKIYITLLKETKPKEIAGKKTSLTLFKESELSKVHDKQPDQLSKATLLEIDAYFIKILNKHLLADGPKKDSISKKFKVISLRFHTDRAATFSSELVWLEHTLSEGLNDGACFKSLLSCYEKLTAPQKFKENSFAEMNTKEEWRFWLRSLRDNAKTFTAKCFCDSLIGLFEDSFSFFDDVGRMKPKGLKLLITFIPMVFSSYGAILFAEELFAVYALSLFLLKGGQSLERSDFRDIRHFGATLGEVGAITALTTTTILVRLIEMSFWTSHQCFNLSLSIGNTLLKPIIGSSAKSSKYKKAYSEEEFTQNLLLASQNSSEGMQFKTPELKVVAAPLESYLGLNAQQFLRDWRVGKIKQRCIDAFLFRLRVLDGMPGTIESKLNSALEELETLKKNKVVYSAEGGAAEGIDNAVKAIGLLIQPDMELAGLLEYKN